MTLTQAVDEALRTNPGVRAAEMAARAARQKVGVSRGLLYGELDAVATSQFLNEPELLKPMSPEASMGAPTARQQLHAGLAYTYPLYVGGRIANQVRIAELGTSRARLLLAGTRADVTYNTTALFVQAQALQAQVAAVQQELGELSVTRNDIELAVKIGKRPGVDLLKMVDRFSEAQATCEGLQSARTSVVAGLLALMGRNPDEGVALAPLPERLPSLAKGEAGLTDAAARRSSVRASRIAADQADRQVAVARASLEPNVALQAAYYGHADMFDTNTSSQSWIVAIQVSLPLFDGGSRRAGVSAARQEAAAAEQLAKAARLQSLAELQGALAAWSAAQKQFAAANAQFDSAAEVARIEQIRYDTGAGDIEDLLRARTRELGARAAQISARAQIVISGAKLNHVTEREIAQ